MVLTMVAARKKFALEGAAVDIEPHRLQQIALGHGADHARHLGRRPHQIVDQAVHRAFHVAPGGGGNAEFHPLAPCGPARRPTCRCARVCWAMFWLAPTISLNSTAMRPSGPSASGRQADREVARSHGPPWPAAIREGRWDGSRWRRHRGGEVGVLGLCAALAAVSISAVIERSPCLEFVPSQYRSQGRTKISDFPGNHDPPIRTHPRRPRENAMVAKRLRPCRDKVRTGQTMD